ncbi:MAG TPA: sialate O-acetylesterase [Candidatus Acidoferrales bacterium]|nr:sialate O-acetylesterase [Candidatus Acidoferrales bacterium]
MKLIALFLFLIVIAKAESNKPFIEIPSIFSDNMVLQQKTNVTFWGTATPGAPVSIKASWGASAKTKVLPDSLWKVKLKTVKAGGPYEVSLQIGDSTIIYKNVMLGEVWLCSGQSNMEMPLAGWPPDNPIQNSAEEIQAANFPNIRLFTVARAVSAQPEFNCVGAWNECNPQTVAKFSAVGYFFGRKLYEELHVPIGLIVSSWGGTRIQSWIGGKFLGGMPDYTPIVEKIDSARGQVKKLNDWIFSHPVIDISAKPPAHQFENLDFEDSLCHRADFDDSSWRTMKLPTYWEATEVGEFDGTVWFRKKIEIPKSWLDTNLVLALGPIDDMDETYVNGVKVGGMLGGGFWATPRIYEIPKGIVKDSVLVIAVRVIDTGGGGGIWGNDVKMQIYSKPDTLSGISLSGDWKYLPVAEFMNNKFYRYGAAGEFNSRPKTSVDVGPDTPTMLFNGMTAPLIPYCIKGTIWYQGESNSNLPSDYDNYEALFRLMIKNWRTDWGEGNFPFYYVQIAPFAYGEKSKSYVVRDAQFRTLSVPNTGIAVTLDIAPTSTIHPPDKQDVGSRLALWALAKDYHKKVIYSGPLYRSMKIQNGKIFLSFDNADGGLIIKDSSGNANFLIAGKDSVFVKANVKVEGRKLIVYSDEIKKPIAVRYTWTNTDEATFFNKEGLPAPTFRTDNWKQ